MRYFNSGCNISRVFIISCEIVRFSLPHTNDGIVVCDIYALDNSTLYSSPNGYTCPTLIHEQANDTSM